MSTPGRWASGLRPDASMTLLREVTEHPLDPGYAEAAAARAAAAEPGADQPGAAPGRRRLPRAAVTAVVAVVLGAVVTTAVLALRAPADPGDRQQLVSAIHRRTAEADAAATAAARLRGQVARLSARDLAGDPDAPSAGPGLLVASGTTAVTGPGLVISLDDARGARPSATADPRDVDAGSAGLVQDVDLREVTNGLWQAGAEAISINGQRLTATTAIRSAGGAILVDFRPLSPPYAVRAIGSPDALDTRFALTRGASWLANLHSEYGISVSVHSEDHLRLAALEGQQLYEARVLPPASGPTATSPPSGVPPSPSSSASSSPSSSPSSSSPEAPS